MTADLAGREYTAGKGVGICALASRTCSQLPGDSTWSALWDVDDPRLLVMETETPPGIRDANFKRDLGIRRSSGDLVSLIDSDMVIPSDC